MTGQVECRYYGRDFTAQEMALLRALIAVDPQPTRAGLSREFCRLIGWFKPDGGLKDMMARVTMLAMHRDGLVVLPPPKGRQHRPKPVVFGPDTEPPLLPAPTTLDEVRTIDLRPVVRETREGRLWNEFVARYHYLGYKTLVGAQMRYAVHDRNGWPFVPFTGALDDILCIHEERTVSNDNTVRYKRLALQIPAGRHRRHYVKARVRVHEYPDGTMAVFHGPRCLARYHADGQPIDSQTREAA